MMRSTRHAARSRLVATRPPVTHALRGGVQHLGLRNGPLAANVKLHSSADRRPDVEVSVLECKREMRHCFREALQATEINRKDYAR